MANKSNFNIPWKLANKKILWSTFKKYTKISRITITLKMWSYDKLTEYKSNRKDTRITNKIWTNPKWKNEIKLWQSRFLIIEAKE